MRNRLGATALLIAVFGLTMTIWAGPASAHAFLASSSPSDGTVLTTAPSTLRLDFSESVVIGATSIVIADNSGRRITPTSMRFVAGRGTEDPSHVIADLPPLARNAYRVSWQTLSSDDLHRTSGVLVFGVRAAVTATPFVEPAPRPDEAILRWLLFVSFATAVGAQLALRLYRRASPASGDSMLAGWAPRGSAQSRLRRLSAIGSGAGLAIAVGLLIDQVLVTGSSLRQLLFSSYGERWALREVGFALLLVAAYRRPRSDPPHEPNGVRTALIWLGTLATCVGSALLGHSGWGTDFALTRTLADSAHLAAAATWAGTLLALALVLLPLSRSGGAQAVPLRLVLRAFGIPAAVCVSVMIVTGVYLASGVVGSVDAALFTFYGRSLLLKVGVVALVGVLGLVNTTRLHAKKPGATPRRTVYAEATLAVVVLALAAVLTSGQPAREPEFVTAAVPAVVPLIDSGVADLQESLAVRPNLPGRGVVLIGVFDTRRPAPAPIARVLVDIAGADGRLRGPATAEQLADGRWSVAAELVDSGPVRVRITVQRPGLSDTIHDYTWVVAGAVVRTRHATVSTAPIGDALAALAGVLAAFFAIAWTMGLRRATAGRSGMSPRRGPSDGDNEHTLGSSDLVEAR